MTDMFGHFCLQTQVSRCAPGLWRRARHHAVHVMPSWRTSARRSVTSSITSRPATLTFETSCQLTWLTTKVGLLFVWSVSAEKAKQNISGVSCNYIFLVKKKEGRFRVYFFICFTMKICICGLKLELTLKTSQNKCGAAIIF